MTIAGIEYRTPGARTPEECDRAADMARNIADRVLLFLEMKGCKLDRNNAKVVLLREAVRDVSQDVILYGGF